MTERLILRPWTDEYADDFALLCSDPEVMRYISRGRPLTRAEADGISDRGARLWSVHGHGPWAALERSSGRFTGRIGLNLLEDWPGADRWEVGWELRPEFWGRGLATEGAIAAVAYGFNEARLRRLISVTVPDNLASRRVMEKAGLTYQATIQWRNVEVVWYCADRPAPRTQA